jgi:hypothetical protein
VNAANTDGRKLFWAALTRGHYAQRTASIIMKYLKVPVFIVKRQKASEKDKQLFGNYLNLEAVHRIQYTVISFLCR